MYADRVDAQANRSIKERLDGISSAGSGFRRNISGKREKMMTNGSMIFFRIKDLKSQIDLRVGANDLHLKLQKKIVGQSAQHVRGSASRGARDLREKLSGAVYSPPIGSKTLPLKPNPAPESSKPPRSNVIAVAPERELKKIDNSVTKKKAPQKVVTVDSFLESLGLEKYSITFQAEEVDMTALVHMSDEDLKAMGIPMGPRKKIRLGLESKV